MKRARIGDVYYVKVPNGYKLYQWAYYIPRKGDYIRVFDGLYATIPENLSEIVAGPHSYIISFDTKRAYRIGLARMLGNFPVPDEYPFPDFKIAIYPNGSGGVAWIQLLSTCGVRADDQWFRVSRIQDLPLKYQNVTLLNHYLTPNWLLYLFDIDFNLCNLERLFLGRLGESGEVKLQKYTDIVNEALAKGQVNQKK